MNYSDGFYVYSKSFGEEGTHQFRVWCSAVGFENKTMVSECVISTAKPGIFKPVSQIKVGEPVIWKQRFQAENNLTVNISRYAYNISISGIISEDDVIVIENSVRKSLREFNIDERKHVLAKGIKRWLTRVEREPDNVQSKQELYRLYSELKGDVSLEEILNETYENIEEYIAQFIKEDVEIQLLIPDTTGDVEITYLTEGPEILEEEIGVGRKIITVSSDIHYENVLASTELTAEAPSQSVKLYHLVNGGRQEVSIDKFDLNGNSLIDYIEWNVPFLSNQTYELIIEISKAEHLDENRTFISDIYDEVKSKDNVWSEPINNGEYARVKFERALEGYNDITIYARSSGISDIEVYSKDSDTLITTFENVMDEDYYKVFLSNMTGSNITFDLRTIGEPVEYDFIVDPRSPYVETVTKDGDDANSLTFSHNTPSANNLCLIVLVGLDDRDPDKEVLSITYNGTNLNFADKGSFGGGGPAIEIWYLVNPDTGSNNVVITIENSNANKIGAAAITLSNVSQTNPIDTGTVQTDTGNERYPSVSVSSQTGDLVMDLESSAVSSASSEGSGQDKLFDQELGGSGVSSHYCQGSTKPGGASVTMTWDRGLIEKGVLKGFNINYAEIPIVITNASTGVEETNATLWGYVYNDGGESCTVRFEWGTTTNYGTNTTNQSKTDGQTFSAGISGLDNGTLYHYRSFVNNTFGSDTGSDMTFLTKPQPPTSLTAQMNNSNTIYLTWTTGNGANTTYVERNTSSSWARGEGTLVYNGTASLYEDSGLTQGTTYYYQAWSYTNWTYNPTLHQWSDNNASASNKTNNIPTMEVISPTNGSTGVSLQPLCQIWANDTDGDTLTVYWYENSTESWVLRQTNNSVTANSTVNWTYAQASNYDITYWWKVAINDSRDNITAWYYFTTKAIITSVDTISPYLVTTKPLTINATGPSNLDNVILWYRYSTDNSSWDSWMENITDTSSPWQWSFSFSNGSGYYEFYSIGNRSGSANETAPGSADAICKFNRIPTITNEVPSNGSTNIQATPMMNITVNDLDGDSMTVTWYSNSSGSWQLFGTNSSVGNGTYHQTNSNFSEPYTTYWWYINVSDGIDTNTSDLYYYFTTEKIAPTVTTNTSTGVEETNATLWGYLSDDGGESCTVRFEWGTTTSYGTNTTNQSKTEETFSAGITGLNNGTLYHYRAYANNTVDSDTGSDMTFLTKPQPPTSLTAQMNDSNTIYLTWATGNGKNNTYIERNASGVSVWSRGQGTMIYNNSETNYEDTGLAEGVPYYYQAWSYTNWTTGGSTLHQWSDDNASANNKTNNIPTTEVISPANGSTGVSPLPLCQIWTNDTDGDTLTVYWYENSTESWVLRQTDNSVTANSTVDWTFSQASSYGVTYWWKVTVNDSRENITAWYYFTTGASINTSVDTISPYLVLSSSLAINATGPSNLDNVTLYYRYSSDNSTWDGQQMSIFEGFESGTQNTSLWDTYQTGSSDARIRWNYGTAHSGSYSCAMDDDNADGDYALNVIYTNYDFTGTSNINIDFWEREWADGAHEAPDSWSGWGNYDVVAFTNDGNTWYEIVAEASLNVGTFTQFQVNISADPDFSSPPNSSFAIAFQQYDQEWISNDGRAWDDIYINFTDPGWTEWDNTSNPDTASPWSWNFNFPNGTGYYEFYSIGNKSGLPNETNSGIADAICRWGGGDISITPSQWNHGDVWIGSSNATTGFYFNFTNGADLAFNIQIKASNATNSTTGAEWKLNSTQGHDNFTLQYNKSSGGSWTNINTTYDTFVTNLGANSWQTFDLNLIMATTSSTSDPLSLVVTFKSVVS
jgi:hypothetical protein